MKNTFKILLGGAATSVLLAGCFGASEQAPLDKGSETQSEVVQSVFEKKLTLEGEELKLYIEEIQAQRFSAYNSFQAFFPAIYTSEIRTTEYKQAIENIVAQYQYVYNASEQLANSYPKDESLTRFFQTVKIESEEIIVPSLKTYYDMNATELLQFGQSVTAMDLELINGFVKTLSEAGDLLSTNEIVNANAAKQVVYTEQRKLIVGLPATTTTENPAATSTPTTPTTTFGELSAEELMKQFDAIQSKEAEEAEDAEAEEDTE